MEMHASLMRNNSLFQVQTVGAYVVTLQIFFSYLLQQVCLTCNLTFNIAGQSEPVCTYLSKCKQKAKTEVS